jgi:hypothetical protein
MNPKGMGKDERADAERELTEKLQAFASAETRASKLYADYLAARVERTTAAKELTAAWIDVCEDYHVSELLVIESNGLTFVIGIDVDGDHRHTVLSAQDMR